MFQLKTLFSKPPTKSITNETFWFPGRWIGGAALIIAPITLLIGTLLRIQYHFFFPQQLIAFEENPILIKTSYNFILAGNIILSLAILTLVRLIGTKKPNWAICGGTMVLLGLFARTFHGGIDHLAFQLVRIHNVEIATKTIANSYGAYHIVAALSPFILFGWIVLAIGAYLSKTLGIIRAIALGLMAMLMLGVLKGSSITSVIAITCLCVALVPLGIQLLQQHPKPSYKAVIGSIILTIALAFLLNLIGQLG